MGVTKEIAYFNAFYIKSSNGSNDWHIEESRIKGGFNNTFMDFGVRAFIVDDEFARERRKNAMIYSGIFNSKTGVNNLNQFSIGASNTKAVDSANGGIQKLYAEDTALIILQEDKVTQAPVDKDFIFTAEGQPLSTTSQVFIGSIIPYAGQYGISTNPESFAVKGTRKYFADKKRGVILRLSRDGLTEISFYGMRDWFKDNLQGTNKIVGMYDNVKDQYILTLSGTSNYTLGFDESSNGWTSFYTYYPEDGFTLNNTFYTFKNTNIWKHYQTSNYNSFYGTQSESNIDLIINPEPSVIKTFHTLGYEGTTGWSASNIKTDLDDSNYTDLGSDIAAYSNSHDYDLVGGNIFNKKEKKYKAFIENNSAVGEDEILFGKQVSGIKGAYTTLTLKTGSAENTKKELFVVSSEIVKSSN